MKTSRIAAAVLVAFLSSSVPHRAAAQDDPITMQARARFKEGVEFYDKGQYENARLAFLQAYALKKHPAVLLNLAQSSAKAGHPLEAAKYFQQFLKESTTVSPQQKQDAETGLAEVRQKLGRIEVVAQAGTEITLDEKERLGTAPFGDAIDVEPGAHTLKSSTETVRVSANAGQKVQARFGAGAPAVAPAPVPTPGPAAPAASANPPPDANSTTAPPAADTGVKHADLLSPPANMTPVYIGLAVTGVGLAGAILFAVFKSGAQSNSDSVAASITDAATKRGLNPKGICNSTDASVKKDFSAACTTLQQDNDKVNTNATIANVSLVVMGVGALTAAGWYLFAPKRDDHPSSASAEPGKPIKGTMVLRPYAGYGNGGFDLSGSF
jgi:hypothetical protein